MRPDFRLRRRIDPFNPSLANGFETISHGFGVVKKLPNKKSKCSFPAQEG